MQQVSHGGLFGRDREADFERKRKEEGQAGRVRRGCKMTDPGMLLSPLGLLEMTYLVVESLKSWERCLLVVQSLRAVHGYA